MDFKMSRKKSANQVSRLLPNVCDFPKENHTLAWI